MSNSSFPQFSSDSIYIPVSSVQNIYIASLTEGTPNIWVALGQLQLARALGANSLLTRPIYLWDLHLMGQTIANTIGNDGYYDISLSNAKFHPMWVQHFNDRSGSDIYKNLPTIFQVDPFSQHVPIKQIYSGDLSCNPLILQNNDTQIAASEATDGMSPLTALNVLYDATVYPAFPLIFTTSFPNGKHYGPAFVDNISYSVSGVGGAGAVNINVFFQGGKSLKSQLITALNPLPSSSKNTASNNPSIQGETGNSVQPSTYKQSYGPVSSYYDYAAYRVASIFDCAADINVGNSYSSNISDFLNSSTNNFYRFNEFTNLSRKLIEMKLSVSQGFEYKLRSDVNPTLNDRNGPRFLSLLDRKVTGSFKFLSPVHNLPDLNPTTTASVALYFGGPFYFIIPNVEWQRPELTAESSKGYVYEYAFIARSATTGSGKSTVTPSVVTRPVYLMPGATRASLLPVSEFIYPTSLLYTPS